MYIQDQTAHSMESDSDLQWLPEVSEFGQAAKGLILKVPIAATRKMFVYKIK